ncbi:methyltransferase [Halioglobus maricola]|uniref:Methyltransferase n=1 Tax=Halioglobus maricola TaxID=2601894 RepID=A0A5P9NPS3_9GAMM|nr:class I SAM-dependent methyltransferase [Halioglobus maricola]QFU77284.1 methyltransferase [Halioglobus maricola]
MRFVKTCFAVAALSACSATATFAADIDPALTAIVEARSEEDRARDSARHPAETLSFFQVEPGMTVAEALPGSGWYTKILAPYLGSDGTLYGVDYVARMWPLFSFATEEWVEKRIAAMGDFDNKVAGFTDNRIKAKGFTFNSVPEDAVGSVDRFLFIRALHNLNRFEETAGTRTQALASVRGMLKQDGLVGVVQHRLPESAAAEGSDGSRGYLKQSDVIAMFEEAGFELVASSEINANPKDKPGAEDVVWRLPPRLRGSEENPEMRAAMTAIGESDRMTLTFRKK